MGSGSSKGSKGSKGANGTAGAGAQPAVGRGQKGSHGNSISPKITPIAAIDAQGGSGSGGVTSLTPSLTVARSRERSLGSFSLVSEVTGLSSWAMICCTAPELPLAARVAAELEDSGLFVKGATSAADGTADRLSLIERASVMLLILDSAFEKDKKAKAEFLHAVKSDTPFVVLLAGPPGYTPHAKWLQVPGDEAGKEARTSLNFQQESDIDSNLAMLVLLLKPHNYSDVAREMSTIAPPDSLSSDDVPSLLNRLRDPTDDKACRRALRQLVGVTLTESAPQEIASDRGTALMIGAIKANITNLDVVLYGCWSLMHLAASSPGVCAKIHAGDGIPLFLDAVKANVDDPSVVTNCFLGLQHMAAQGFHMRTKDVGVVVDAMVTHPHDAEVQLQSIRLIHSLAIAAGITKTLAADLTTDAVYAQLDHAANTFSPDYATANAALLCKQQLGIIKFGQ